MREVFKPDRQPVRCPNCGSQDTRWNTYEKQDFIELTEGKKVYSAYARAWCEECKIQFDLSGTIEETEEA